MVLEIELANAGLAILKSLENLIDQSVSHYALSFADVQAFNSEARDRSGHQRARQCCIRPS
ncbi:hypothetical protein FOCG_00453 [Fusarium oxysporum f. sp. radicis-lycopersici 26381]|uniref:Uncharacterized protein n=2 Tax=Fusarium oxysporum TaxID=5507 RepID=W9ISC6_FUSOX|nr:hypothetical protein FOYG_02610 [Fusarium oxysporum NRRL 32931]EWZ43945.1 hypothetical protein FOZG_04950 [Fusarium oxysporum Fo47]EWZ99185.1 hypothetical protein FOWG_02934 [Fusarium oxysporum f. sp. lycopersici MN25]EXL61274.1 hypothetical protein FOCG_00453 [Fusarium oxysporum f. sp. radicis-lycopersici 26381]